MFDAFDICVALGPVAIYLLLIGWAQVRSRPVVISGQRDALALCIAISGWVLLGPARLFLPDTAAVQFGGLVWPLLGALYLLFCTLLLLNLRPRLVVYHISGDEAAAILQRVWRELDPQYVVAGNTAYLPRLGLEMRVESMRWWENTTIAVTGRWSPAAWHEFERVARPALAGAVTATSSVGTLLVLVGAGLLGVVAWQLTMDSQSIAQSCRTLMRF